MARLEEDTETGQLYIRIPRGIAYSAHGLNRYGVMRIKQLGLSAGDPVPFSVRQLLDQYGECQPPCGVFRVRLRLDGDEKSAAMFEPQGLKTGCSEPLSQRFKAVEKKKPGL